MGASAVCYNYPGMKLPSKDTKIWRYMTFAKFLSLLDTETLFFATVEALKKDDPYEGSPLASEIKTMQNLPNVEVPSFKPDEALRDFLAHISSTTVVNCWHIADFESAAMWKIYAPSGEGIAIQSTVDRLCQCFKPASMPSQVERRDKTQLSVFMGEVDYLDFPVDDRKSADQFHIVTRKSKYYEFEHELRAFIDLHPLSPKTTALEKPPELREYEEKLRKERGIQVDVDIETLIERIVVMEPMNSDWFYKLVESVTGKLAPNGHEKELREKMIRSSVFTYRA